MKTTRFIQKNISYFLAAVTLFSPSLALSDELPSCSTHTQNSHRKSEGERASIELTAPLSHQTISPLSFSYIDTQTGQSLSFPYKVVVGSLPVSCKEEKNSANISYIAYFKETEKLEKTATRRPIVFCVNGGPSSSSVWLHLGGLAPKRVHIQDMDWQSTPATIVDNPHNLLKTADLVFIDPVSTGYSTINASSDQSKFYGIDEDIDSLAKFIHYFIREFALWQSEKYLIGESYGAIRVAGIAAEMINRYMTPFQGIALISGTLDCKDMESPEILDSTAITAIPTFAAIARYHKRLEKNLLEMPLDNFLGEIERFCVNEYCPALFLGSQLSSQKRELLAEKIARYIGLPKQIILEQNLKISTSFFALNFFKEKRQLIGRFDGRYTGTKMPGMDLFWIDPSLFAIAPAFVSALNSYLTNELHVTNSKTNSYEIFSQKTNPSTWNWQRTDTPSGLGYSSLVRDLQSTLSHNPQMKIFVASGIYDLALPYFGQEIGIHRLLIPDNMRDNISIKRYDGGHMMYLISSSREKIVSDLATFIEAPSGIKIEDSSVRSDKIVSTKE